MHNLLIPFTFVLLSLSNYLYASDNLPVPAVADEALLSRPFLYEVKKGSQVSYILGSIHFDLSTSDFPSWVTEIHKHSRVHAYEILYSDFADFKAMQDLYFAPNAPATIKAFKTKMQKRHPRSLGRFNPKEVKRLMELGFSRELAENFPTDRCSLFHHRDGFLKQPYRSMDEELMLSSFKLGIKAVALEDDQLRAEAARKYPEKDCDIRKFMWSDDTLQKIDNLVRKEQQSYIKGEEATEIPSETDYRLFFRNRSWMPKIIELVDGGDAFITVGVFHLMGRWGLLAALEKAGYEVTRVTGT